VQTVTHDRAEGAATGHRSAENAGISAINSQTAAAEVPVVRRENARPVNLPEIPPVQLTLPEGSGLELVETKHRDASTVEEPAEAPRAKRVRPPRSQPTEEPLQMVETKHDAGTGPSPGA
jgi:hypothetical protein